MWERYIDARFKARGAAPGARSAGAQRDGGRGRVAHGRGQVPVLHARLPRRADARHAALRARARRRLQRREPARGHGRAGRRRADPLPHRRRPVARPRVPRHRAARRLLPRLQRLDAPSTARPRRDRLRWAAMLPLQDVDLAIAEARRAAANGAAGVLRAPQPGRRAATSTIATTSRCGPRSRALDRPICIHDSGSPHLPSYGERMDTHTTGHILAHPFEAMSAMMSLIWYGVFEHFPRLTRRARRGRRRLGAVPAAAHGAALGVLRQRRASRPEDAADASTSGATSSSPAAATR